MPNGRRARAARSARTATPTSRSRTRPAARTARSNASCHSRVGRRAGVAEPQRRCRRRRARSGWRIRISSIAPIALNSVAPWRRAESRKPLAENRGSRTRPAPARERAQHRVGRRVDVEQRQRVISRSSAVQLHPVREALAGQGVGAVGLHDQLRPPGGARGRDQHRQVVGLATGESSCRAYGGRTSVADGRYVEHPQRRHRSPATTGGSTSSAASWASVTTSRGRTWPTSPASSAAVPRRVGRHGDRAERGQGQPEQQVRRRGARRDHDEVAAADPARVSAAGGPALPAGRPRRRRSACRRRCAARPRRGRARPRHQQVRDRLRHAAGRYSGGGAASISASVRRATANAVFAAGTPA